MTYRSLAESAAAALTEAGIENAANEAVIMLRDLLGFSATRYLLERDLPAPAEAQAAYLSLIEKRCARIPMQYLLQQADFLGNTFRVGEGVLIPRPETEELSQLCIDRILEREYRTVFDLCAGSGCIGISIARSCPKTQVWLIEKYVPAVLYLKSNVPQELSERVHVLQADVFTADPALLPKPDLIVSNPPYIASAELCSLQPEVQKEPQTALDGGADGLDFFRCIASRWGSYLEPGGYMALECGETQTQAIAEMLLSAKQIQRRKDMFGRYRFVTAEY